MQLIKAKVTAFVSPPSPPSSALTNPSTHSVTSLLLPPPPPPAYHTLLPWLQGSQSSKNCRQLPIRRWVPTHTHRYQPVGYSHQSEIFKPLLASYCMVYHTFWLATCIDTLVFILLILIIYDICNVVSTLCVSTCLAVASPSCEYMTRAHNTSIDCLRMSSLSSRKPDTINVHIMRCLPSTHFNPLLQDIMSNVAMVTYQWSV